MVDFDDLDKAFNAENVLLQIANTIGAGQTDFQDVISTHVSEESIDNPITRKNTRGGPLDFYASAIIEYTLTSLVTKKIRDRIRSLSKQNTRNALQTQSFQVEGQNLGVVGDDTIYTFDSQVSRYRGVARETGEWAITFTLRILNSTFT